MGFPRQENWSGLPFLFPGDLPNPGTEHISLYLKLVSLIYRFINNYHCLQVLVLLTVPLFLRYKFAFVSNVQNKNGSFSVKHLHLYKIL